MHGLKNCNLSLVDRNNSENVNLGNSPEYYGETGANAPQNAKYGEEEQKGGIKGKGAKEEVKGGMDSLAAQMCVTGAPGVEEQKHKSLATCAPVGFDSFSAAVQLYEAI